MSHLASHIDTLVEPPPLDGSSVGLARVQAENRENTRLLELGGEELSSFRGPSERLEHLRDLCRRLRPEDRRCAMDNEMAHRRRRVKRRCAAIPRFGARHILGATVDSSRLLVMPYRQLVWCPVYKVLYLS